MRNTTRALVKIRTLPADVLLVRQQTLLESIA
ncbi:MAG: hypothetical protein RLZZ09_1598, partial [Pseudomonadota bacterium]